MLDPVSRRLLGRLDEASAKPLLLMYHGTPQGPVPRALPYSIQASKFAAQLDLLQEFGWQTVCVRDLDRLQTNRAVAITFDDGYADNVEGALRPLADRGMKATWFMVSGRIGKRADWLPAHLDGVDLMTSDQLRMLADEGMEVGSHTRSHPDLTTIGKERLEEEIGASRAELEDVLGRPVTSFAYPYGRHTPTAVDAVRAAGYEWACSVRAGWYAPSERWLLRRVTVFHDESIGSFARKLCWAANDVRWRTLARYAAGRVASRLSPARGRPDAREMP